MKKFFKLGCFGFLGLIVLAVVISAIGGDDEDSSKPASSSPNSSEQAKDNASKKDEKPEVKEGVLTEEKFAQIKDGMSYEEVVGIVGADGTVLSETGEAGSEFHTVMYEFKTDGFMSSSTMMFQGGKLINKAQFGLGGGSDVEISIDQFNQIQNGMTLEEVIEVVGGEGEIISESGEKGTDLHTVVYSYNGDNLASNVTLMFQGNKLMNKSQFGLD